MGSNPAADVFPILYLTPEEIEDGDRSMENAEIDSEVN